MHITKDVLRRKVYFRAFVCVNSILKVLNLNIHRFLYIDDYQSSNFAYLNIFLLLTTSLKALLYITTRSYHQQHSNSETMPKKKYKAQLLKPMPIFCITFLMKIYKVYCGLLSAAKIHCEMIVTSKSNFQVLTYFRCKNVCKQHRRKVLIYKGDTQNQLEVTNLIFFD